MLCLLVLHLLLRLRFLLLLLLLNFLLTRLVHLRDEQRLVLWLLLLLGCLQLGLEGWLVVAGEWLGREDEGWHRWGGGR